nr:aminoacylase-1B-like [Nerophis lumbriciformis]
MRRAVLFLILAGAWQLVASVAAPASAEEALVPADQALRWLREYVQIDTTNPPGNEHPAAEYLAAVLAAEGIESQLLTSPGGRTSLYARVTAGRSNGGALLLMHHLDVVPASAGWSQPAFSGRLHQGQIWGRGALDSKSLGIAQLVALIRAHRVAETLERDLVLLAVADEEAGGAEGAGFLLQQHGELLGQIAGVLNEGGSNRVVGNRLAFWGIEVTQKRPLWLRVSVEGRGGHASGFFPDSPLHRLLEGLARLATRPPRPRANPAAGDYLAGLARLENAPPEHLYFNLDQAIDGQSAAGLPPGVMSYFLDSLQVTTVAGGESVNAVASRASATLDIRLLPDTDGDAYLAELREQLGEDVEVEVLLSAPPAPASPTSGEVFEALRRSLERGIPAYGFSPFALPSGKRYGIHGTDEHLPRAAFLRGVETLWRVVKTCIGAEEPVPPPS